MGEEKEKTDQHKQQKKNWLEWVVFGVSVLLTITITGYLGYKVYAHHPTPPDIGVTFSPSPTATTPYRYHLTIENTGGETAEEVVVELALEQNGETIEKSQINLPFVPQSSKRESWANFTQNPALADTVLARVVSFRKP